MAKKNRQYKEAQESREEIEFPKGFVEDFKRLDSVIGTDVDVRKAIESALELSIKLDLKTRWNFITSSLIDLIGTQATRALRFILVTNNLRFFEAIKKRTKPSEESVRFLASILLKWGYEFDDLGDAAIFENDWKTLTTETSYDIETKKLNTTVHIVTTAKKTLILDGTFRSIAYFACTLSGALREDLESAKKAIPELKTVMKTEMLEKAKKDLDRIKLLCEKSASKADK